MVRTVCPQFTDEQRASVLAQPQIDSGYALDGTESGQVAGMSTLVLLVAAGGVLLTSVERPRTPADRDAQR